jgi:hypothetical protein
MGRRILTLVLKPLSGGEPPFLCRRRAFLRCFTLKGTGIPVCRRPRGGAQRMACADARPITIATAGRIHIPQGGFSHDRHPT